MTWKFKQNKENVNIFVKNNETKSQHTLGKITANLWEALIYMSEYFSDGDVIDLKNQKEFFIYKSLKGRTLVKQWNHHPVFYRTTVGLPNN